MGDKLKNGIKSASVPSNRLVSNEITQWKIPDVIKNMMINTYPMMELKKLRISFKYNAFIESLEKVPKSKIIVGNNQSEHIIINEN